MSHAMEVNSKKYSTSTENFVNPIYIRGLDYYLVWLMPKIFTGRIMFLYIQMYSFVYLWAVKFWKAGGGAHRVTQDCFSGTKNDWSCGCKKYKIPKWSMRYLSNLFGGP